MENIETTQHKAINRSDFLSIVVVVSSMTGYV